MQTNIFLLYGRGLQVFFVWNNDNWGSFIKNVIASYWNFRRIRYFINGIMKIGELLFENVIES